MNGLAGAASRERVERPLALAHAAERIKAFFGTGAPLTRPRRRDPAIVPATRAGGREKG